MTNLWHGFADMGAVDGREFVVDRGEGCYVWDENGRRYLDGTASLWYVNVGYGRDEIARAAAAQLEKLHAYHVFGDFATRPVLDLADRLAALAPVPESKVFLTSGGSDSVDTAAKLARRYFHEIGQPGRTVVLTRTWAYHGMHAYGTALAGIGANRDALGELVAGVEVVQWDSVDALAEAIDRIGADRIAAFFCEPVVGAGGVRFAPDGYLSRARETVRDAGALFVSDEVITGFGRVGEWFASHRFGLDPDLLTFAKGVTSGYLPLGGVLAAPHVAEPFWKQGAGVWWRHGYTYSGHTSACAAGLANLGIIEREGLDTRARTLEAPLADALEPLLHHPFVSEVRTGAGLLAAVQLDPAAIEADASLPGRAAMACRNEGGVITRALAGGGLQISPPLVITEEQLGELAAGLRAGLDAVA
ncbi:MAG: aspartate aminotransferase family protein [Actinobacteria bacterium]|nr:MAG: aspartate aminotransferase family protein [Actinomycetota bacterium]